MTSIEILKKYWGFDSFREQQGAIVESVINGKDTLALLPTGGGKSICFQVPGLAREGICIVISPLIALMQDQVKNLKEKGIKAAAITSGMSRREIDIILDNAKFGGLDFLYVSPERLKTEIFITRFQQMKVALIAVDEAHCISQWGHDFRPPYLTIYQLREVHKYVPIIAVTATATQVVREDIIEHLKLEDPAYFEGNFARENISYEVYQVENKRKALLKACKLFEDQTGIVYCQTRRETKEITKLLLAHRLSVSVYHGGMNNVERKKVLDSWMAGQTKIMVATNAFGMGIDKPNVRFVLHYEMPNNLEAYFQEAGRAGRDGELARNLAFYTPVDIKKMEQRLQQQFPPIDFIKTVYRAMCNHFSIAIGSGNSETYGLNIQEFVRKYDFEPLIVYNAFKILEMNGSLLFNEGAFHPTKLKFIISNKTLYNFQISNEKFDPIISFLSRKYTGIFAYFVKIDESVIAKRLNKSKSQVVKELQYLEKQGLLDISWRSELPQVTLLHERLPDDYMRIDKEVYENRKETAYKKLNALIHFLQTPKCRSILLLNYFGQDGEKCGKCDICLAEQKIDITSPELIEKIKELVAEKEYTFEELMITIENVQKSHLSSILHWMVDERIILYTETDTFAPMA